MTSEGRHMERIVKKIRAELKKNIDESTRRSFQRFFKEDIKYYGVKTGTVDKIASNHWKEMETLGKKDIFKMFEELFKSDYTEEAFIVSFLAPKLADESEPGDIKLFERWIGKYINNWAKCDSFCNHTVGSFVEKYPSSVEELKTWTKSKNRWLRRAAAVSLIVPAKHGGFLKDALEIADKLLLDKDDMVQKGYGWLLKEASRMHQKEVFDYVMKKMKSMPRTALRYAIELMPRNLKSKAMKID
jgi:3-methyladenine DNA glycosylase AlkD